jgi:hypothetical protein
MEEMSKFWSENLKGRDHSEDLGIDGEILEWILWKWGVNMWTGCIWLRIGPVAGSCEHGNDPSCSIKDRDFDQLIDC